VSQLALRLLPPAVESSRTSLAAADAIQGRAASLRAQVLALLQRHPEGLTDEAMQDALGMQGSTQRPRRVELVGLGLVVDSGRTAKTKSGRSASLWVAR
jgi:hypothetical protein